MRTGRLHFVHGVLSSVQFVAILTWSVHFYRSAYVGFTFVAANLTCIQCIVLLVRILY